jgi:peptide/nickel transport system ATP-binding protein
MRRASYLAVRDVSLHVQKSEILGIVGESGCGKSMTALSIMRLLPPAARQSAGTVRLDGRDLTSASEREMRRIRGNDVAMVFQEPTTSLDPCFTIGFQLIEAVRSHSAESRRDARDRAVAMLERVGIPRAGSRLGDYPHEFSGGMRQRVLIAMALLLEPQVLIADEPTTALDVTIQAQILDLLTELRASLEMSIVLITHNLGVIYEVADRVVVMYAGEVVESRNVKDLFADPRHPYTQGLLRSMPDMTPRGATLPVIRGRVPELQDMPVACRFAPRCPNRLARCDVEHPELLEVGEGDTLRCFNPTPFTLA